MSAGNDESFKLDSVTMNAVVLKESNGPTPFSATLSQVPMPLMKPVEALVRVHCAALNRREVWMEKGVASISFVHFVITARGEFTLTILQWPVPGPVSHW
jgi:NADPH:quinone reductase-like Zn-dependent oxidoreductase